MTDPRRVGGQLRRAADLLRCGGLGAARGPWLWADPDPEAGAGERTGRPTSPKDLPAFPVHPDPHRGPGRADAALVDDAVRWPEVPAPRSASCGAARVASGIARPLADLLDALAPQVVAAVDAGGSLDDEPFRSALRLAAAVLGPAGARPGPTD
ncbi:hypothetical protein [Pseudonocardia abyssalis]|uniref:Uncharacterized protein n=1 Tax=Pseudonocardia abyssalis TaxID=2792008 RepID=A0ABS6UPB1_9PSEU|nr:hypothetical protein [Pseudonocardia abyssalis]MBW0133796.1 hypothetical protein [Pseudonocardia abyssalis]